MQENIDLLTDMETRVVQASHGRRFVNFLVDFIVLNIVAYILYEVLNLLAPDVYLWLNSTKGSGYFASFLTNILLFGTIMAWIEILTKGRSLGKLITNTKAVREDGNPITMGDAFARGFARLVPFEAFSALGSPCYPWHDRWTKTYVIDLKESILKQEQAPGL